MWLSNSSVEVFIWDSGCCVQWIWIITSSPHLSQQRVNDDDNLNVNTSNYFIPCVRKQRKGSQSASFPVSDIVLRQITFLVSPFPTHMLTHFFSEEQFQLEELSSPGRWGFVWHSTSPCHCKQNFILPAHLMVLIWGHSLREYHHLIFQILGLIKLLYAQSNRLPSMLTVVSNACPN